MTVNDEWFEKEKLHYAAQHGKVEEVRQLLAEGYNPNTFDDLAKTPLHYAAEREHIEIMQVLIEAGADVNAYEPAKVGNTPLREVADRCSFEAAKLLVDAGADPTIPGWMQLTALDLSKKRLKPEGKRVHQLLYEASHQYNKKRT